MAFCTIVRAGEVEGVDGLAGLEEDVRVLGGAAEDRPVRGEGAGAVRATRSSVIMARRSSSVSCSTLATSCEVRKPSKKCRNGMRDSRVAAWAIRAKSMTSCTELEASRAKPVARPAMTSCGRRRWRGRGRPWRGR